MDDLDDLGMDCPDCADALKISNAGGYRAYCQKCVDAMPPLPRVGGGFQMTGEYPDFKWVVSS